MAKANSRGQRVKSFQVFIPQMDLTHTKEVAQVYLDADAHFVAYLPEHVANVVRGHARLPREVVGEKVLALSFDPVKRSYDEALKLFVSILQAEQKERVIRIIFAANRRREGDHHGVSNRPTRVSFAGNQCLEFTFGVCWKVNGRLYRQDNADSPLIDIGEVPKEGRRGAHGSKVYVVDWTAEREAFLQTVDDGIATLVARLCLFMGHDGGHGSGLEPVGSLLENFERAIAGGGLAALPAPEVSDQHEAAQ